MDPVSVIGGTKKLAIVNVYGPVTPHLDKLASTEWWRAMTDLVKLWVAN